LIKVKKRIWMGGLAALLGLAVIAQVARVSGRPDLPPVRGNVGGGFAFAVLGDAPYNPLETLQYTRVLADLDAHELAFVIHVGDILASDCSDERYRKSLDWFNGLRHPVIYSPGDNEWTDCRGSGHPPLERLGRLRQLFFARPGHSLGGRTLAVDTQAQRPEFAAFVENTRWHHAGITFCTVHLVGSKNGHRNPGAADAAEADRRTAAAAAWLRETFAEAQARGAGAVVVAFHAYPFFERPAGDEQQRPFEPFLLALEEETERFARPVLAVHGDYHVFQVDQPLVRRTTGRRLENFTRMQVPGSPRVGWVRVQVPQQAAGVPPRFEFERRVLSRWKLW
jgi:hypothetical protein